MRIDYLAPGPDRAGRYSVRFDDGSVLRLYRQTLEDFSLYAGKELSAECYKNISEAAGKMSAKMRAVRIVSASSVSKKDLQQRLVQKGEEEEHAIEAVRWMEELHLVDDRATAEQVVHSCISKGYGISRAKQALYEKRIPKVYWDEALAEYPDQNEKIMSFLRSRLDAESDRRDIKRAVDALIRRGHSYPQIRSALERLRLDAEEFPEE